MTDRKQKSGRGHTWHNCQLRVSQKKTVSGVIREGDYKLIKRYGDRGYHVRTKQGTVLEDAYSGAVFRCERDGSGLEVFATGL